MCLVRVLLVTFLLHMKWGPLRIEHISVFFRRKLLLELQIQIQAILAGNLHSGLEMGNNKSAGRNRWSNWLATLDSVTKQGKRANPDSWSPSALFLKLFDFNSSCMMKHPQTPLWWSLPWFKEFQWIFFTVRSTENLSDRYSGLSIIISFLLINPLPSPCSDPNIAHVTMNVHARTHTRTQNLIHHAIRPQKGWRQ